METLIGFIIIERLNAHIFFPSVYQNWTIIIHNVLLWLDNLQKQSAISECRYGTHNKIS